MREVKETKLPILRACPERLSSLTKRRLILIYRLRYAWLLPSLELKLSCLHHHLQTQKSISLQQLFPCHLLPPSLQEFLQHLFLSPNKGHKIKVLDLNVKIAFSSETFPNTTTSQTNSWPSSRTRARSRRSRWIMKTAALWWGSLDKKTPCGSSAQAKLSSTGVLSLMVSMKEKRCLLS